LNDRAEIPAHATRSLAELLEAVAAETPAPGGGASAAWATALAAALVEMSARFTRAREEHADVHERMQDVSERAGVLRDQALALAERELHAYEPVLDALRLPRDDPGRAERLRAALSAAAEPPREIAAAAAEVAELAAEVAATGNRSLEGDAVTGGLLADAACRAATRLVEINLSRS
jgi:methenyltetrahydrofolate cyclohydrolase